MDTPISVEITTTGWAVGGAAVGRDDSGRAVFAAGALAGERVRVAITREQARFANGEVEQVLTPSADRVEPSCPEVANGCGGCDFAHVSATAQREAKQQMVTDALTRIGRVEAPQIASGPMLADRRFRSTVRAFPVPGSAEGRVGLLRRASHDTVAVASCEVAHPLVQELLVEGRYPGATEVMIRVGIRTGERLVVVTPTVGSASVPDGVILVGADELDAGRRAWIHEEVAGHTFRVSARSFFQTRPEGADALVELVRAGAGPAGQQLGRVVDLCAGVGVFAATMPARSVVAVEPNASAIADARINLRAHSDARIVRANLARWHPEPADVVIADPPRAGLGKDGVRVVAATGAARVVLISCDAGSLGRDAGLLTGAGFALDRVELVDMFPQTSHVEVVSTFTRRSL